VRQGLFTISIPTITATTKGQTEWQQTIAFSPFRLKKAINKNLQPFENHLITNNFIFTKIIIFAH
jgi:hypothetical protein